MFRHRGAIFRDLFRTEDYKASSHMYVFKQYLYKHAGLVILCSEQHPEDGTSVPKHVGGLYL
jgi:hypothetical protein